MWHYMPIVCNKLLVFTFQEASKAVMPHCRRDKIRNELKSLKGVLVEMDRLKKASQMNDVSKSVE
jgi:hypothetical protein